MAPHLVAEDQIVVDPDGPAMRRSCACLDLCWRSASATSEVIGIVRVLLSVLVFFDVIPPTFIGRLLRVLVIRRVRCLRLTLAHWRASNSPRRMPVESARIHIAPRWVSLAAGRKRLASSRSFNTC